MPGRLILGGVIGDARRRYNAPPDRYAYDPRNPVPTLGGAVCCNAKVFPWGPMDQRPVERRRDVLVYDTQPLKQDLEVTGPVKVVLHVSTSAPDTDFTAKLVDVFPDGHALPLEAVEIRDLDAAEQVHFLVLAITVRDLRASRAVAALIDRAGGQADAEALWLALPEPLAELFLLTGRDAHKKTLSGIKERLFGGKVFLQIWVKVKHGWADDERALKTLGYE